jgi:hypothetical protein
MRISLCRERGELVKRVELKGLRDGTDHWAKGLRPDRSFQSCSPDAARRCPITLGIIVPVLYSSNRCAAVLYFTVILRQVTMGALTNSALNFVLKTEMGRGAKGSLL